MTTLQMLKAEKIKHRMSPYTERRKAHRAVDELYNRVAAYGGRVEAISTVVTWTTPEGQHRVSWDSTAEDKLSHAAGLDLLSHKLKHTILGIDDADTIYPDRPNLDTPDGDPPPGA